MDPTTVGRLDAIEAMRENQVRSLQELENIEALIQFVKEAQRSVERYKKFKKKKIEAIDDEINILNTNIDKAKQIIVKTLNENGEKSVRFPGTGKVSKRQKAGGWEVKDEVELLKILEQAGETDRCVKTEVKQTLKKTELNKLLKVWEQVGKLPDCVEAGEDGETAVIQFEDVAEDKEVGVPQKRTVNA